MRRIALSRCEMVATAAEALWILPWGLDIIQRHAHMMKQISSPIIPIASDTEVGELMPVGFS